MLSQISPSDKKRPNLTATAHYNKSNNQDEVTIALEREASHCNNYLHPFNDRNSYKNLVNRINLRHEENDVVPVNGCRQSWGSTLPQYQENLV